MRAHSSIAAMRAFLLLQSLNIATALSNSPGGKPQAAVSAALASFASTSQAAKNLALNGFSPTSNYIRIRRARNSLQLQTASVTLSLVDEKRDGKPFELGLVSTVHLAEPPYYAALQREADGDGTSATPPYDRVLFEFLVDESVVETDASGVRRLKTPLSASPTLAALAASNRLTTQVEALDCMADERWVLADVSRAELAAKEVDDAFTEPFADAPKRANIIAPLRNLLGSGPANAQNPFWRLLLCLLPAPEAALLLDDWVASGGAVIAPALRALIVAVGRLDFGAASRLSFAQTLASGESTQDGTLAGALVRWRNARALEEVDRALSDGATRIALLYGALHMRDLRLKLQGKYRLESVSEPKWTTAWTIQLPPLAGSSSSSSGGGGDAAAYAGGTYATTTQDSDDDEEDEIPIAPSELLAPGLALLTLFAVDGSDWLDAVRTLATALATALADDPSTLSATVGVPEAAIAAALYLGRHALIYFALQRWAFQWDGRWWAVESGR